MSNLVNTLNSFSSTHVDNLHRDMKIDQWISKRSKKKREDITEEIHNESIINTCYYVSKKAEEYKP